MRMGFLRIFQKQCNTNDPTEWEEWLVRKTGTQEIDSIIDNEHLHNNESC